MKPFYEVITREIAAKGKGYLLLRRCAPQELEEALGGESRCGFAVVGGVPVGVYELVLSGECPEIAGIAIHPDFQGKGLGRALLAAVLGELAALGYARCQLLVATDNERAFSLYRKTGFKAVAMKSRWFQMLAET